MPFAGANLLLTRTFFSLQRPWLPTALGAATLVVNVLVALALLGPFGTGDRVRNGGRERRDDRGPGDYLRRELGGRLRAARPRARSGGSSSPPWLLARRAYAAWRGLDDLLGRSLPAQVVSVGGGLAAGIGVYCVVVLRAARPRGPADPGGRGLAPGAASDLSEMCQKPVVSNSTRN